MEWTKSDTLKFIEFWHSYPCLWDSKSSEYKNKHKRRDAFENIAQLMCTDTNSVEKKIISLKTQFNREVHKLKTKTEAGIEEVDQPNWYAFEYLLFLKDNTFPRQTNPVMIIRGPEEGRRVAMKRKLPSPIREEPIPITIKQYNPPPSHLHKKDECSAFGETVASELREIRSKRHLLLIKKEIMDLVFRMKLEILDSEHMDPLEVVTKEVEIDVEVDESGNN